MSRQHAAICVRPRTKQQIGEPSSICIVNDLNSKYGTFIVQDDVMMQIPKEGYKLKDGDRIQLAMQNNTVTVEYVPIVTLFSSLNSEELRDLVELMTSHIDGAIVSKWMKRCTHLTVVKPKLTEKLAFAMAAGIPIVTLNYWRQMKVAIKERQPMPNAAEFAPMISESVIENDVPLYTNLERRKLFADKIFMFFCKEQYELHRQIIDLAGGNAVLYSRDSFSIKDLCTPNVIVVQYPFNDITESTQNIIPDYDKICDALKACRRRMIPQLDISLSLLYCSTSKFCNPSFRMEKLLTQRKAKPNKDKVLVIDTQDPKPNVKILPNVISNVPVRISIEHRKREIEIIPETCDDFDTSNNDSIRNQVNESTSHSSQTLNAKKTNRKRKYEIIPETIELLPEENGELDGCEKRLRISSVDDTLVPETNESSFKETETNVSQTTRKRKRIFEQEAVCIPETNDLSQENTPVFKKFHSSSFTENYTCIPETMESSSLDMSSKSTQPAIHITKEVTIERRQKPFTEKSSLSNKKLSDDADVTEDSDKNLTERESQSSSSGKNVVVLQIGDIELTPIFKSPSKQKKDVDVMIEPINTRDEHRITNCSGIGIIPETQQKNVENSDRNLMRTSSTEWQYKSIGDIVLDKRVNENCDNSAEEERSTTSKTNNTAKQDQLRASIDQDDSSITDNPNFRKPIGKLFKKVYHKTIESRG